jgi:hypothetical protein
MTCPCCLPACCPAWRAFDGSDRFFRYLALYDWDVPTRQLATYTVTAEIDGAIAVYPGLDPSGKQIEIPFPLPRQVDGHWIIDAADSCAGYAEGPSGTIGYGWYASSIGFGNLNRAVNGAAPGISRPWRRADVFNVGSGLANFRLITDEGESWVFASGDPGSYTDGLRGGYFTQKYGTSLIRYKLFGEYSSPPSPYCHTRNPLP